MYILKAIYRVRNVGNFCTFFRVRKRRNDGNVSQTLTLIQKGTLSRLRFVVSVRLSILKTKCTVQYEQLQTYF